MALKSHAKLTSTLCVLLKLTLGIQVMAVLAGFYDFHSYSNLPVDADISEILLLSDTLIMVVGLAQIVLGIVTSIVFLRWVYISNKMLRAVCPEYMTFTPGWSVGWFFIPIANVWKPYQVMKEMWVASHKGDRVDQDLVGWWWALFLATRMLNRITYRLARRADDVVSYNNATLVQIAADGVGMGLTYLALTMVSRIGAALSENLVEPTIPSAADSQPMIQQ